MIVRITAIACLALACSAASPSTMLAAVTLHGIFSSNMVLQQQHELPVWGAAEDGEQVTVTLNGQKQETTAKDGKWEVRLKAMEAGGPYQLVVQGTNKLELNNVMVGEVWICSGQSNMQWTINSSEDAQNVVAGSANDGLRLFTVPRERAESPQDNVVGSWSVSDPATVGGFSAVAYHFGKSLQKQLNVPVGLVSTNFGGTAAEEWTSREALEADEGLKHIAGQGNASKLYNAMIHPLLNFPVRGVIWYQGESNASRAYQYRTLFPAMIKNWREDWNQDFPFLFVQLAPFTAIKPEPGESNWAELREAQLLTMQTIPKTAMVVITDLGDEKDIHPKKKAPVGERLALAARAIAYGEPIEYSGPIYDSMEVNGNQFVLKFTHVGQGLTVQGDKLQGFTVAGEDRKFHPADARIEGDVVIVHSPQVDKPVAVRYGWANYPVVNLGNQDGLLASPFRTDDWPGVTQKKKGGK